MRTGALVVAAVAAVGATAGAAAAQSTRYPPPPVDLDAEREGHSAFWEAAIEPGRGEYDELLARARTLLGRRDAASRATAIELAEQAAALLPARPDAWAVLGLALEQAGDARGCRDALDKAWAIDPAWRGATRPLGLALGSCRARAGDLEGALDVLERLVARGDDTVEARWRLGEVYVALGRLDDARGVLEVALDRSAAEAGYVHAAWTLAVAADRARDPEATRAAGEIALRLDPQRGRVEHPPGDFLEPHEADYYAGLAADLAGAPEVALLRFRRYVSAVAEGPWLARAREHIAAVRDYDLAARTTVDGTDRPDRAKAGAVVAARGDDLRACLAEAPELLVELRVTLHGPADAPDPKPKADPKVRQKNAKKNAPRGGAKVAKPAPPNRRRPPRIGSPTAPPPAGVTATVVGGWEADTAKVGDALRCVERVGAALKLTPPETPGTWGQVRVPLIAR